MTSLNNRTTLSTEDYNYYLNQVKGYEGECYYDTVTKKTDL